MSEDRRVAIVGLGLIGGSLAIDLSRRGVHVLGYDANPATLARAVDAGAVHEALGASLEGLRTADILVLAVPVAGARTVLAQAAPFTTGLRLITDTGSTKAGIVEHARRLGLGDRFVGAHPLTGDDRSGWAAARPGLFEGARVFTCPAAEARADAAELVDAFWRSVGAHPEAIDADAHDRALAWTSHLPQATSSALAVALDRAGVKHGDLGPGGRGMTRLAASSPAMWAEIATENAPALRAAVQALRTSCADLLATLDDSAPETPRAFFDAAARWAAGDRCDRSLTGVQRDAVDAGVVVAFQGEAGAHSEAAVHAAFGVRSATLPCRDFADVREAVLDGRAAYGVLPVENSSAGSIVAAYEVLARPGLSVLGEVVRPIRHALLGLPGSAVGRIRRVLSHPAALAQCTTFLGSRRWIDAIAFYDTAGAAAEVARTGDTALAAVAAHEAAARYGLEIIAADIHDRADNRTRFVVVGRPGLPPPQRADGAATVRKSALVVDAANRPGALADVLLPFARRGIDLTHIQSTPGDRPWTYRFIVELAADVTSGRGAEAVAEVQAHGTEVRVLGSFAAASEAVG